MRGSSASSSQRDREAKALGGGLQGRRGQESDVGCLDWLDAYIPARRRLRWREEVLRDGPVLTEILANGHDRNVLCLDVHPSGNKPSTASTCVSSQHVAPRESLQACLPVDREREREIHLGVWEKGEEEERQAWMCLCVSGWTQREKERRNRLFVYECTGLRCLLPSLACLGNARLYEALLFFSGSLYGVFCLSRVYPNYPRT